MCLCVELVRVWVQAAGAGVVSAVHAVGKIELPRPVRVVVPAWARAWVPDLAVALAQGVAAEGVAAPAAAVRYGEYQPFRPV